MGACGSSDDTDDTTPTKDKDKTVTVTFDLNYAEATDTPPVAQTIKKGDNATAPTDPTRDGYTFDNWYADATTKNVFAFTTVITADMTLYAGWTPVYTVTFDLGGGTGTVADQAIKKGDNATAPVDNPTKDGYTFNGWYTQQDGSGTAFAFAATPITDGSITLYAGWQKIITYTVTFDGNYTGAVAPTTATVAKDDKATKPADPTRTGYAVEGWYDAKTGGNKFDFDATPITADITLYARWTLVYSITLGSTKYAGVADDATQTILVDIGKVYKKINGQTVQLVVTDNAGTTGPSKDVTLTQAKATINVTRDGNTYTALKLFVKPTTKDELTTIVNAAIGGEGDTVNLNFVDTSLIKDMSEMFRNKQAFNGDLSEWDTAKVTNMSKMFHEAQAFNQNISKWDTANVTNMSGMFQNARAFNQDIGNWDTGKVTDMSDLFNTALVFNQDIGNWKTGEVTTMYKMFFNAFTFNRNISQWKTGNVTNMREMFIGATKFDQDLSTTWDVGKVTDHESIFVASAMANKTAKHPKFPTAYTVTFDTDGGNRVYPIKVVAQGMIPKPKDPTKDGATFGGWYTEAAKTKEFIFTTPITADITLYAKWN